MRAARSRGLVYSAPLWAALALGCGLTRGPRNNAGLEPAVPLDPVGLARLRAQPAQGAAQDAGPTTYTLRYRAHPLVETGLEAMARALERRAQSLEVLDAHAMIEQGGTVRVELRVSQLGWRPLFEPQLGRRGDAMLAAVDPQCNPFGPKSGSLAVRRAREFVAPHGMLSWFMYALPSGLRESTPRRLLEAQLAEVPVPEGRRVVLGPVRFDNGEVAWRTYCVRTEDALFAPRFVAFDPTLDRHNLLPILRAQLDGTLWERFAALTRTAMGPLLLVIDGEAQPVRVAATPVLDGRLEVTPRSRSTGFSPEVMAAILRSGALPVGVRLEWLPAP